MAQGNRSKELWLIPKRVNLHQSIVFVEAIEDRHYDGQSWNESKQNNLGVNLKNKGATKTGKNISSQAIRTLLASIPQYLGFVYIDDTGSNNVIRETDAGKLLVNTHKSQITNIGHLGLHPALEINESEIARDQLLKLQLTNPIVLKDCENISVFPFRFLLKLLLEIGYIDLEEIAYILLQTKDEDDLSLKVSEINAFRNQSVVDRTNVINNYKNTHFGNITLVQAPSARYFISLCELSGLVEHVDVLPRNRNDEIIALKIKETKINDVKNIFLPKYNGIKPYDFKDDLKLWIKYIGDPSKISTPYDADIENKTQYDVFCVVKKGSEILASDVLNANGIMSIPAFVGESYSIELYSLISGSNIGLYRFSPTSYGDYYQITGLKDTKLPEPSLAQLIADTSTHVNTGSFPKNFGLKLGVLKAMTGIDFNTSNMRGAYLEYNFFRILCILKNQGVVDDVIWNGKIGKYSLPVSAPGGKLGTPDIIFEIDNEYFVLELTTIKAKSTQFSAEGASVPDHIRLFADQTHHPVHGIFSAPIMHVRVNNAMESTLNGYGLHIKCLTVDDLLLLFGSKNRAQIKKELS